MVMSRDTVTGVSGHPSRFWLGLVVLGGVEGELAEEFSGAVTEDADVQAPPT